MTARSAFAFFHPLRVRWAECDGQGIVFNVNYFLYFDVAVTEYMRALGYPGPKAPEVFTVHAEADYKASARFDEMIEVGVRVARLGRTSMRVETAVFRDAALLVSGALVYVHAEKGTQAASPLPDAFRARVRAFEKTPPEE